MEETALSTLRTMLERRKLSTTTERITTDNKKMASAKLYTIGDVLVAYFDQKDKVLAGDITNVLAFAEENGHTSGIVIVAMSPPSENVLRVAKSHAKKRVAFFHVWQLQFDITTHRMAMPHRILDEEERNAVFDKYKISDPENQLPWIDSQDTMIKWIGAIPGDVVEVTRHSDTAGRSLYYRYCVEDVNVAQ
jgi:DNA-directed RNA polymerase subunit H (RpoH/RPB5)